MKNAIIFTLGCRLNTADAALLTDRLERAGYSVVAAEPAPETVALVIVNSCSVTAEASRKSRQAARQFRRRYPMARIVATGCSAEIDREAWEADGSVDAVLSNPGKRRIEEFCDDHLPVAAAPETSLKQPVATFFENAQGKFPFRSRAFLKIQEGCNNFCTYCIVPYSRGPERSRNFDEVVADCRRSLDAGFTELVLTGVNTAAYSDNGRDLAELVGAVCALPGEFRVRLSSTEPHPANRNLLEVLRDNPKVCRFLHLSLQHGADRILERMHRKYTAAEFAGFMAAARAMIPGISLGTDVIVGFPGETEEDFERSRAFIREMNFANTHLFRYSPRPGTPAATYSGQVPGEVAKRRFDLLHADAVAARLRFAAGFVGQSLPVIFEEEHADGTVTGWSDNYIHFRRPAGFADRNRITPVTVLASDVEAMEPTP